jgi:hypothetical protein
MEKPNIIFKEVNVPQDLLCDNGHIAPQYYKRNGIDSEELPIRFWHVTGSGINKTICEPCMTILNYLLNEGKHGR